MKKIIVNDKGLFLAEAKENQATPFEQVEISDEIFQQALSIRKTGGLPVLVDGAFVDKKDEKSWLFSRPAARKFFAIYPNNIIGGEYAMKPDDPAILSHLDFVELNQDQANKVRSIKKNKKIAIYMNGEIAEK